MKKYVFFDFDGTLFDTAEGIVKSVQYALKKLGIDAEPSELMCFAGPPLEDMFRQKYGMDEATAPSLKMRDFLPLLTLSAARFLTARGAKSTRS